VITVWFLFGGLARQYLWILLFFLMEPGVSSTSPKFIVVHLFCYLCSRSLISFSVLLLHTCRSYLVTPNFIHYKYTAKLRYRSAMKPCSYLLPTRTQKHAVPAAGIGMPLSRRLGDAAERVQGRRGVHGRGVIHAAGLRRLDAVVHQRAALQLVVVLAHAVGDLQLLLVYVGPNVLKPAHVSQLLIQPARVDPAPRKNSAPRACRMQTAAERIRDSLPYPELKRKRPKVAKKILDWRAGCTK
jgi:hypothetical protein